MRHARAPVGVEGRRRVRSSHRPPALPRPDSGRGDPHRGRTDNRSDRDRPPSRSTALTPASVPTSPGPCRASATTLRDDQPSWNLENEEPSALGSCSERHSCAPSPVQCSDLPAEAVTWTARALTVAAGTSARRCRCRLDDANLPTDLAGAVRAVLALAARRRCGCPCCWAAPAPTPNLWARKSSLATRPACIR